MRRCSLPWAILRGIMNNMEEKKDAKKTVVVVDDDLLLSELYQTLLRQEGAEAFVAHDGEEGVALVRDKKPGAVILDIRMPKLDGIEVLKIIKQDPELKSIPVLLVTNYDLAEYREAIKGFGVADFITKATVGPKEVVKRALAALSAS